MRQKLSSRKFWCAIIAVIIPILALFGIDDATIAQIIKILTPVGVLVAYIFAESYVDVAREQNGNPVTDELEVTELNELEGIHYGNS